LFSALQRLEKIREEKQHTQRLTQIFNHLTDGICFISDIGNIRFINQSMTALLGVNATAVLNQSVHTIFQHLDLNLENSHQILTVGAKKLAVHLSLLKNEHIDGFILSAQDLESFEKSSSEDRKSTRLNSSHVKISYAVFC